MTFTFEENLKPNLLRGLFSYGIKGMNENHRIAFDHITKNHLDDIIIFGNQYLDTATSLIISILQKINEKEELLQCVLITPTREVAINVGKFFQEVALYMKKINILILGYPRKISVDIDFIVNKKPQIIIGTIGRMSYLHKILQSSNNPEIRLLFSNEKLKIIALMEGNDLLYHGLKDQIWKFLEELVGVKKSKRNNIQIFLNYYARTKTIKEFEAKFMNPLSQTQSSELVSFFSLMKSNNSYDVVVKTKEN